MKQFFEQYGAVALGILALLVLIAMITPVGNIIKTSLQGTVQTFSTKMNEQTDTMTSSLEESFINSSGFSGVRNSKFYLNGEIFEPFAEAVINENPRFLYFNDLAYRLLIDLNVIDVNTGRVYDSGFDGLIVELYEDGTKVGEGRDICHSFSIKEEHTYKGVVTNIPSNIKVVEEPMIKKTYELIADIEKYNLSWKGIERNNIYITYPIFVEILS